MPSSSICIDASFVVGLVTHPKRDDLRGHLRHWQTENVRLVAPSLVYYELANVGFQMERHGRWTAATTNRLVAMVLSLPLETVGDAALHTEAIALARRLSLPATYDAHYLALAERLDCEMWTLDRKLERHATRHDVERVRLAA